MPDRPSPPPPPPRSPSPASSAATISSAAASPRPREAPEHELSLHGGGGGGKRPASRSLSPDDARQRPSRKSVRRSPPSPSGPSGPSTRRTPSPPPPPPPADAGPNAGPNAADKKTQRAAGLRAALDELGKSRAGGAYIPPARLRALMAEAAAKDPSSVEYQRMSWDALKKSITGLINKVAVDNIKMIIPELFAGANLVRGRGLYCRAIMRAQSLSRPYTPVFAALTAVINTKLPAIGALLVTRLVSQFRRAFKRNDKPVASGTLMFLAHLVNQRVAGEVLALEILVVLLENPTDDSTELAVTFLREVGHFLTEEAPKATTSVMESFRHVLYEAKISKRVQYMVEVLAQLHRKGFSDHPRIPEGLDLVEEDDQITHEINLTDELNVQESLNAFRRDPNFTENEAKYAEIKAEILGEDDDSSGSEIGSGSGSESESEAGSDPEGEGDKEAGKAVEIHDMTETEAVNLRRTIYLTIMSSAIYEEAVHKLLKLQVPPQQQIEVANMVVECCSQERTYTKFYGQMGVAFCRLGRGYWSGLFEDVFRSYYEGIHRYETPRIRNIAMFFGAILASDSISWSVFELVHMNEEETTSSSRIFVKILFKSLVEHLGLPELIRRFIKEPGEMAPYFAHMFPTDTPRNMRFSINYFTAIDLGPLTEPMRAHLKELPRIMEEQRAAALAARKAAGNDSDSLSDSGSASDSSTLSSSTLSSSYDSRSSRSYSRSPRSYSRSPRSYSRSPRSFSRSYSRSRSRSFTPSDRSGSYSRRSRSYTPPSRHRSRSYTPRSGSYTASSRSRSYTPLSQSRSPSRSPSSRSRSYTPSDRGRSRTRSYTPRSYSRSRSYSYSRSPTRSYTRSPSPRGRSRSHSRSRSSSASSRSPSPHEVHRVSDRRRSQSRSSSVSSRGSRSPLSPRRERSITPNDRNPSPQPRRPSSPA